MMDAAKASVIFFALCATIACDGELLVPHPSDRAAPSEGDQRVGVDMGKDQPPDLDEMNDSDLEMTVDISSDQTPGVDMTSGPIVDMSLVDMVEDVTADMPSMPSLDLKSVKWLHHNVQSWSEGATLSRVTLDPRTRTICMQYDKANDWPIVEIFDSRTEVVGNAWVFIFRDGQWHGATWEWLRPGQTCKSMDSVAGDHIKVRPFDAASNWTPRSGEVLYFMVSGLARMPQYRNVEMRTAPVRAVWP